MDQVTEAANEDEESPVMMDLDDSQQCDAQKRKSRQDPTPDLPSQHHHGAECPPSLPPNNLPVLGLCAPNFTQPEPSRRNYSRPSSRPHFPFSLPQTSGLVDRETNNQEPSMGKLKPHNVKEEPSHQPLSNMDGWLPVRPVLPLFFTFNTSTSHTYMLISV